MLILGINGSPQKEKNTSFFLQDALEVAKDMGAETHLLHVVDALEDVKVPFCNQCSNPCSGVCFRDNKLGEFFNLMCRADGIIVGSPVYFGTVTGQLKGFWDKSRYLRVEKSLVDVVGGALAIGGSRFGGQETTVRTIHDMMLVQGMTVVGDGCLDADAGHQGACAHRPIKNDESALVRARIMVQRVVEVAQVTKPLRQRRNVRAGV